jgi:hypothetical protein
VLISQVKPDKNSILHFFDNHHAFFTKAYVYFTHKNEKLRASLLYSLQKKGHFFLENIEVFHQEQWSMKKGDHHLYGLALADQDIVDAFAKKISSSQLNAKNQLERRFRALVLKLSKRLCEKLQSRCQFPVQCEVSSDYLNIITSFDIDGEVISGNAEMKNFFPHTVNDEEYIEELLQDYVSKTLEYLEKYLLTKPRNTVPQNVYVTTIPIVNPISEQSYDHHLMYVTVYTEGNCPTCKHTVKDNIHSSLKIDLHELERYKEDLIIKVVGDSIVCVDCKNVIKKEKLIINDVNNGQLLAERFVENLILLGTMNEKEEMQSAIITAIQQDEYFQEHEESFWNAYSYVATQKWEEFLHELTRKELENVLPKYISIIPVDSSKEKLIALSKKLDLNEKEKQAFWRKANQHAVNHYLFITVFGWDMKRDIALLGKNRAQFLFRYLPMPEELKPFHQIHEAYFFGYTSEEIIKIRDNLEQQHHRIRELHKENGRLTEKLGQAYSRIGELEQTSFTVSNEVRNKSDILKIQQLKGLIEEFKTELSKLTPSKQEEVPVEKVVLIEEEPGVEIPAIEEILKGKKILILGGYRNKQRKEDKEYTVYTHDARNLDPEFYELMKVADIIIVLTRYISHRAMWEAKEYAILEGKRIYYTAFTNIPTILNEVAKELMESKIRPQ